MAKYIVEAPEPKKGQKASSGRIRENGKSTSQFKNPIPYNERILPPAFAAQKPSIKIIHKEQARTKRNEIRMYLLGIVWQEFGEPLLLSGLHRLRDEMISIIGATATLPLQNKTSSENEKSHVGADEIDSIYDDNKTTA